jgi:arylsulfatase A-like enzyme
LVTIDTLRADRVHCYGYSRISTPALDSLASDGIRFDRAFTPSPITNTSHATIMTGLLPSAHGVNDFAIALASPHATWAELLRKQGYRTAAFIGSTILDSKTLAPGLDRGFDFYDNFPQHSRSKPRWGRLERRAMVVVQHAETWLDAHSAGPHFVWVHLYDPHDPYEPPPPYSRIYNDRLYDGEIAYADSALRHFLAYLKQRRWYDEALIIAVGDHGEGLGEHHENTHGIFLYDSTLHVPLIN